MSITTEKYQTEPEVEASQKYKIRSNLDSEDLPRYILGGFIFIGIGIWLIMSDTKIIVNGAEGIEYLSIFAGLFDLLWISVIYIKSIEYLEIDENNIIGPYFKIDFQSITNFRKDHERITIESSSGKISFHKTYFSKKNDYILLYKILSKKIPHKKDEPEKTICIDCHKEILLSEFDNNHDIFCYYCGGEVEKKKNITKTDNSPSDDYKDKTIKMIYGLPGDKNDQLIIEKNILRHEWEESQNLVCVDCCQKIPLSKDDAQDNMFCYYCGGQLEKIINIDQRPKIATEDIGMMITKMAQGMSEDEKNKMIKDYYDKWTPRRPTQK